MYTLIPFRSARRVSGAAIDPAEEAAQQLRDLERHGGGMASIAHLCAGLLLICFSAGSLLSLSLPAFQKFSGEWATGRLDVPDAINVTVNLLLVLCMDVAMLYAASVLRVLASTGADPSEGKWHARVMLWAALVEAITYAYMLWQFDHPADFFQWGIGLLRAGSAPLFAVYLAMARQLPVAPRDILYHANLASGKGFVRDVAVMANDPDAPTLHKAQIFHASSRMTSDDRTRLDGLLSALTTQYQGTPQLPPPTPPNGPENGLHRSGVRKPAQDREEDDDANPFSPGVIDLAGLRNHRAQERHMARQKPGVRNPSSPARVSAPPKRRAYPKAEAKARAAWKPGMSIPQLERAAGIARPTAQKYHAQFSTEETAQTDPQLAAVSGATGA